MCQEDIVTLREDNGLLRHRRDTLWSWSRSRITSNQRIQKLIEQFETKIGTEDIQKSMKRHNSDFVRFRNYRNNTSVFIIQAMPFTIYYLKSCIELNVKKCVKLCFLVLSSNLMRRSVLLFMFLFGRMSKVYVTVSYNSVWLRNLDLTFYRSHFTI
jgi:hypothetical protein